MFQLSVFSFQLFSLQFPLPFRYILLVQKPSTESKPACWGLLRRRSCLVPTWRGGLVLLLLLVLLAFAFVHNIYPFLAPNDSHPGGVLVVEGWGSDGMLQAAIAEYQRNHYEKVYVTGVPIEHGAPFFEQHSYAELGAALLVKFGLSSNAVQAVPAPHVLRDRTFTSALALKHWFQDHQPAPASINLFTVGAHARRSRMLFQRALGKDIKVGVIALQDEDFDPKHWWRTSEGVRSVIGETLAYGYARFLFRAPKDNP